MGITLKKYLFQKITKVYSLFAPPNLLNFTNKLNCFKLKLYCRHKWIKRDIRGAQYLQYLRIIVTFLIIYYLQYLRIFVTFLIYTLSSCYTEVLTATDLRNSRILYQVYL